MKFSLQDFAFGALVGMVVTGAAILLSWNPKGVSEYKRILGEREATYGSALLVLGEQRAQIESDYSYKRRLFSRIAELDIFIEDNKLQVPNPDWLREYNKENK